MIFAKEVVAFQGMKNVGGGHLVDISYLAALEKTCQALQEGFKVQINKKKNVDKTTLRPDNLHPLFADYSNSPASHAMTPAQRNYSSHPD